MELHLCPSCDAFVRSNWTSCRACGHALDFSAAAAPVTPEPAAASGFANVPEPYGAASSWPESTPAPAPVVASAPVTPLTPVVPVKTAPAPAPAPAEPVAPAPTYAEWSPVETTWDEPSASPATAAASVIEPPAPAPVAPTAPVAEPVDDYVGDEDLRPIMLSYTRAGFSGPTSAPVAVNSEVFTMAPNMLAPALSKNIFVLLSAGGALVILIPLLLIGAVAFLGSSTTSNDKLVSVGKTATTSIATPTTKGPTTTAAPVAPQWIQYEAPDGSFNIDFPTTPSILPTNSAQPDKVVYQSETKDQQSAVLVVTQNSPAGSADNALIAIMNADAASLNAKVSSHSVTTQNARRTLSAHMTAADSSADLIAFEQNGKLFTLLVATDGQNGNPTLFGHVSSTFAVSK